MDPDPWTGWVPPPAWCLQRDHGKPGEAPGEPPPPPRPCPGPSCPCDPARPQTSGAKNLLVPWVWCCSKMHPPTPQVHRAHCRGAAGWGGVPQPHGWAQPLPALPRVSEEAPWGNMLLGKLGSRGACALPGSWSAVGDWGPAWHHILPGAATTLTKWSCDRVNPRGPVEQGGCPTLPEVEKGVSRASLPSFPPKPLDLRSP